MNQLIDISNPNLDYEGLLGDILDYCIYLENIDPISSIEYSEKDGKHITLKKYKKTYDWGNTEISKLIIDDNKKSIVSKFYFGGEADGNQTKYEQLLNNLKICTKSTNPKVGKLLLALLRIIIDNHPPDYFVSILEFMNEVDKYEINRTIHGKNVPANHFYISEIIDYLSDDETYRFTHDIRDNIYVETKLSGYKERTKIFRFIGDVDVWDLYRIGDGLGLSFTNKRDRKSVV